MKIQTPPEKNACTFASSYDFRMQICQLMKLFNNKAIQYIKNARKLFWVILRHSPAFGQKYISKYLHKI